MTKNELIFDGKEKKVFATEDPDRVIIHFLDVTLAYNGVKRARFIGKGEMNNRISALLLGYLNRNGVDTHFLYQDGERDQVCRKIAIVPLEVTVHNRIAGTLAVKLGLPDGFRPANTVVATPTEVQRRAGCRSRRRRRSGTRRHAPSGGSRAAPSRGRSAGACCPACARA